MFREQGLAVDAGQTLVLQVVTAGIRDAAPQEGALAAREALNQLKGESTPDWSFVSPPIGLAPGERTGQYRLGADELLAGQGEQPAGISVPDLAVAIVDEIEQPRHLQRRFTVAN